GDESVVEPSGRTNRKGVDFSLRYELFKWLYIDGDINLTKARYTDEPEGQNYVQLAAGFTSIGGITLKPNKVISASIRYRHMGNRPAVEDNSLIANGYTVCDAVVNYIHRKYEFGLQIQNLFNVRWNEAQFATETRLKLANGTLENKPFTDICFTPGSPFFLKVSAMYKF
ncbi:MAG: TonB-dependent receptor, partial [Bacteroidetes bacterium]|nr:TonB-dependent receptor [Bacteroidota bacterium]